MLSYCYQDQQSTPVDIQVLLSGEYLGRCKPCSIYTTFSKMADSSTSSARVPKADMCLNTQIDISVIHFRSSIVNCNMLKLYSVKTYIVYHINWPKTWHVNTRVHVCVHWVLEIWLMMSDNMVLYHLPCTIIISFAYFVCFLVPMCNIHGPCLLLGINVLCKWQNPQYSIKII